MNIDFNVDNLSVKIYNNRVEMGVAAASDVIARIKELLAKQKFVNVIFAAAPSQNEFLAELRENTLEWNRVRAFHMDEYIGLDGNAPQRFGNFLDENIFGKLPFLAIHYLNGSAKDEVEECNRYNGLLKIYPVDIVCMGIGENGHMAFNDPPVADFKDPQLVKVVELEAACRQQQVNDGCFASIDEVPVKAITLTIPALMAAKFIFCMVPGATKATAVYNTLNMEIIEQYPATVIRTHANAALYLDELSASKLPKQTV